ncbi:MAG TPA: sigma-70 family RNA polymerase sigma factor [Gaiellaceae bacterium]|nr:sigma-70 family RNA polymerase sigma factor [Gaiellaceae bacterium]
MTSATVPELARDREEAAARVGGLFERHSRMVYGICRAMLRDVHEAEDATQQVFLSAHKALLGGAQVRDPAGWLATIARNECRARAVAGMRRPLALAGEDLDALPASGDDRERCAQVDEIRDALAELPERQREAVVLRYLYGLRYGEVAKALDISRPATEALLFRARRALRVSLRPVAGVLVVPAVVREELALALPGFEAKSASVAASAGVAGGILAKLTAGSAGVKVATTAVAVATVGTVGTASSDRAISVPPAVAAVEHRVDTTSSVDDERDDSSGGEDSHSSGRGRGERTHAADDDSRGDSDRSGASAAGDDEAAGDGRSGSGGPGSRTAPVDDEADEPEHPASSGSGSTSSGSSSRGSADSEPESESRGTDSSGSSGSGSAGSDTDSESSGSSSSDTGGSSAGGDEHDD